MKDSYTLDQAMICPPSFHHLIISASPRYDNFLLYASEVTGQGGS